MHKSKHFRSLLPTHCDFMLVLKLKLGIKLKPTDTGCCGGGMELKQTKKMEQAESRLKENQALIMSVENPVHRILFLHAFCT